MAILAPVFRLFSSLCQVTENHEENTKGSSLESGAQVWSWGKARAEDGGRLGSLEWPEQPPAPVPAPGSSVTLPRPQISVLKSIKGHLPKFKKVPPNYFIHNILS